MESVMALDVFGLGCWIVGVDLCGGMLGIDMVSGWLVLRGSVCCWWG